MQTGNNLTDVVISQSSTVEISIKRYNKILNMLLAGAPLTDILAALVNLIEQQQPGTRSSVLLLSSDGQHLQCCIAPSLPAHYNHAIEGLKIGVGIGSCGEAAYTGKRVIADDIANHPNWQHYRQIALGNDLLACWSEPIKGSNGNVLGTFAMYYAQVKSPKPADLLLIQEAARLASLAIERSRSFQFQRQASAIFTHLPIALVTTNDQWRVLTGNPCFYQMMQTRSASQYFVPGEHILSEEKPAMTALFNQLEHRLHWQGEVQIRRDNGTAFYADITVMAVDDIGGDERVYAWLFFDISARKQDLALIDFQANFDALTSLPNRSQLFQRIESQIEQSQSGKGFTLMLMDLDNFKQVNDNLGHHYGDQLLMQVAQRLNQVIDSQTISHQGVVARLSGDEFAILLPNVLDKQKISELAQALNQACAQPYLLSDAQRVYTSSSIGIALYPQDAESLESLLNCADQAMYAAKDAGRNQFTFFNLTMRDNAQRLALLYSWLKTALLNNEFEVYYQPVINLVNGKIIHAEALLRWRHGGDFIGPDEFIPVAESCGLIIDIGHWVREQAMHLIVEYGEDYDFSVAVNVSSQELLTHSQQQGLLASIESIVTTLDKPFDYNRLTIEITESVLIDQASSLIDQLTQLRQLGCSIAVDDFGTGYSSLSYLYHFPSDQLKIDKSFIHNCEHSTKQQALVNAIAKMSQALELNVVAEGVENKAQLDLVQSMGIQLVQGYYFSRPLPKADFIALLREVNGTSHTLAAWPTCELDSRL